MDDVDGEVGQKMRSAIKAKLTELGCYVDDELPDYVMVMVANKRTRSQMEDDLQLFLGDNTELFVNWLHQVLKKLQEVSATPAPKSVEVEKKAERSKSKEKKAKDKKEKVKKSDSSKKSKKKAKEKSHKKKDEKKKSKKKSKHEMIRPNIPPLLMNIEKESEPSITDVFAGQILKNHGVILETHKGEPKTVEQKPVVVETKRPAIPIIDPATILSQPTAGLGTNTPDTSIIVGEDETDEVPTIEDIIRETNEIEMKIEETKEKLMEQSERADSTDDEDFLNIRTEADELMNENEFGDDVFKEAVPTVVDTPPLRSQKTRSPTPSPPPISKKKEAPKEIPETLPQIELNLPKRPIRERLGAPTQKKDTTQDKEKDKERRGKTTEKAAKSPERNTPELELIVRPQSKSAKSRLGSQPERSETRKRSTSDESEKSENSSKRLTSRVSVLENRPSRVTCASVVRVRPRPRVAATTSSLLLRAVADAHKSLLNIPPKVEPEPQKVKRALVLPMRRNVDPKKIVIQVPCSDPNTNTDSISDNVSLGEFDSDEDDKNFKTTSDVTNKDEYRPFSLTKVINNTEYVPSRTVSRRDDFVETINIHNTTVDKDKGTQFIVTMDGYHPNAFLAKKLMTEGLLNDDEEIIEKCKELKKPEGTKKGVLRNISSDETKDTENIGPETKTVSPSPEHSDKIIEKETTKDEDRRPTVKKRKSDSIIDRPIEKRRETSIERPILQKRDTSTEKLSIEKWKIDFEEKALTEPPKDDIIIKEPISERRKSDVTIDKPILEKRKSELSESSPSDNEQRSPPVKRRKASPIVFDVHKKEKEEERVRERTVSASSDSVILTTASNTHKYDALPPLSQAAKPSAVVWCRAFPQCRYGALCAFAHPRCKFAAACTRRGCVYSHSHITPAPVTPAVPVVASHVVPAANYKTISAGAFANICKYYPSCSNPACHYYHPKPCRYGKACTNKLECNFYHIDAPGTKWKYSV